jgi:hypothetical protein
MPFTPGLRPTSSRASWPAHGLAAQAMMVEGVRFEPRRKTYIYVNNRLEGNALATIAAMIEILDRAQKV